MTDDDLEQLAAAGVYDSTAIDARDQRRLLEQLLAQGLTADELATAHRLGGIVLRAFEHLLLPGERVTVADAVTATGLTRDQVLMVRRGWGLPDPPADSPCFTPEEVAALEYVRNMAGFVGPDLALHVARVMGMAMSRVAEAEVSLVRSRLEVPLIERHESGASMLRAYANLLELFLPAGLRTLDLLHRAHLVTIGRRYTEWASPPSENNVVDAIVGFADLTGSTLLVQHTDLAGLDRALTAFERITSDLLAAAGASVVKRLGDGVMFVAPRPDAACRVALDLVDAFRDQTVSPPVRVGLAAGPVAALRGDFFGAPVHLAARIVSAAPPSAVLVSEEIRARAQGPGDYLFVPAGPHVLPGFGDPIELYRVARTLSARGPSE